jgi:hypothetical protein
MGIRAIFYVAGRMKKTDFLLYSNIMLLPNMFWSKFILIKY